MPAVPIEAHQLRHTSRKRRSQLSRLDEPENSFVASYMAGIHRARSRRANLLYRM
jgi:hypothetical protein